MTNNVCPLAHEVALLGTDGNDRALDRRAHRDCATGQCDVGGELCLGGRGEGLAVAQHCQRIVGVDPGAGQCLRAVAVEGCAEEELGVRDVCPVNSAMCSSKKRVEIRPAWTSA